MNLADDEFPDPARLRAARDAFYAMPLAAQRGVLNDWMPQSRRDKRADMIEQYDAEGVLRVMFIECERVDGRAGGPARCFHTFQFSEGSAPVRIVIREGTRRAEVLSTLRKAAAMVTKDWESMIAERVDSNHGDQPPEDGGAAESCKCGREKSVMIWNGPGELAEVV